MPFAGYLHHVRAVLGKALCAGRAGQNTRQVEDPNPRQRAVTRRQGFGRRVADPDNLDERNGGRCRRLRHGVPFLFAAHQGTAPPAVENRIFERKAVPFLDLAGDRGLISLPHRAREGFDP